MKYHRTYLLHIRDAILKIEEYSQAGKDGFSPRLIWQDAIIRQLEILG